MGFFGGNFGADEPHPLAYPQYPGPKAINIQKALKIKADYFIEKVKSKGYGGKR